MTETTKNACFASIAMQARMIRETAQHLRTQCRLKACMAENRKLRKQCRQLLSRNPHSRFLTEKNAKNTAYAFILSHGLFQQFADYCSGVQLKNPYAACISHFTNH